MLGDCKMKCDIHIWNTTEDNSTCWKCNELKYKDRLQMKESKVKVIENIPDYFFMFLEEFLLSKDVPWYWNPSTSYIPKKGDEVGFNVFEDINTKETPQFTHLFIQDDRDLSKYSHFIKDVSNYINEFVMPVGKIVRVKANLLLKDENYPKEAYHPPHSDVFGENYDKQWTFLYYINDSDGDTIVFDKEWHPENGDVKPELNAVERHTPKAGNALLFKSNIYHTSSPPKTSERRIVLNFIFEPK
jgi:hypothetical protein